MCIHLYINIHIYIYIYIYIHTYIDRYISADPCRQQGERVGEEGTRGVRRKASCKNKQTSRKLARQEGKQKKDRSEASF